MDISLRASFFSAPRFSKEIRARKIHMALKAPHSPVSVKKAFNTKTFLSCRDLYQRSLNYLSAIFRYERV